MASAFYIADNLRYIARVAQDVVNSGNSIGGVVRMTDRDGNDIADRSNMSLSSSMA